MDEHMDEKKELQMIMELMEELQDKMQYGEDDFNERLGKEKPKVDVVKIEGSTEMDPMELSEKAPMDMHEDMEMSESPEDKLKARLMKMRK